MSSVNWKLFRSKHFCTFWQCMRSRTALLNISRISLKWDYRASLSIVLIPLSLCTPPIQTTFKRGHLPCLMFIDIITYLYEYAFCPVQTLQFLINIYWVIYTVIFSCYFILSNSTVSTSSIYKLVISHCFVNWIATRSD